MIKRVIAKLARGVTRLLGECFFKVQSKLALDKSKKYGVVRLDNLGDFYISHQQLIDYKTTWIVQSSVEKCFSFLEPKLLTFHSFSAASPHSNFRRNSISAVNSLFHFCKMNDVIILLAPSLRSLLYIMIFGFRRKCVFIDRNDRNEYNVFV